MGVFSFFVWLLFRVFVCFVVVGGGVGGLFIFILFLLCFCFSFFI